MKKVHQIEGAGYALAVATGTNHARSKSHWRRRNKRGPPAIASGPSKVEAAGIETPPDSSRKTARKGQSGAQGAQESAIRHAGAGIADPELRAVVNAWPTLAVETRQAILQLVSQHTA
jgi:hypothetical protein